MKNAMQLKAIVKNMAKEKKISAQLVLQNYMLERVSLSSYRENFIIKGGFLIASMVGLDSRATMDMDATIKGYPVNKETIQNMIVGIIAVPVDDSISFEFKSIGEIREGDEYTGYVETVVQLSKGNISTQNVRVEFSLEDMDMSGFQQGATYEQIQEWVQEKYGFHVTHLNIAQVKQNYGILERENYNRSKSPDSK